MNARKQASQKTTRNQRGRFMGTKRKLILLREREHGGYAVQTFQHEMTPKEHLQWHRNVVIAIRAAIGKKPQKLAEKMAKNKK